MPANFGAEHIDLSNVQFTPELLSCIPAGMVQKLRVLPVFRSETQLGIAMADPSDLNPVDTLAHHLNCEICLYVADACQLAAFIERLYDKDAPI